MADTLWQLLPAKWQQDAIFRPALIDIHREIYQRFFHNDPRVNPQLGFHLHAYCRSSHWRSTLILTPWMMSRLMFPEQDPHILIPDGWSGEDRSQSEYQPVGPSLKLGCHGNAMVANLNYHTQLGHYLIQPFALSMRGFKRPREAFEIWDRLFYAHALRMQRMSNKTVKRRLKQRDRKVARERERVTPRDGTFDHSAKG
ncbi:MAG: [NiFe]-hydrogenase assembly chaperone HybE [Candidatus Thiodiazotropha sp.]